MRSVYPEIKAHVPCPKTDHIIDPDPAQFSSVEYIVARLSPPFYESATDGAGQFT